jgi:ABC-2 type transport system ATP-binding protein
VSKELPVEVRGLVKTYRIGFFRKRVEAVRGIDFEVRPGEIFGLLGPNGAGKTTSIKVLLRLIFPTEGEVRLFGRPVGPEAMRRLGYLPENPYVYQYLRPLEFLDLCGRLAGLGGKERLSRARTMIDKVGLGHAADRPIGRFSKGMMQRIGLAQALLHDPELLILDEPMSGLDPIGRKEVRDLLLEQRRAGKTLLFTSHILSDVEMLCDRVAIVNRGRITARGTLRELLRPEVRRVEVELEDASPELAQELEPLTTELKTLDSKTMAVVDGDEAVQPVLERAMAHGARVASVTPHRETLEDLFMRNAVPDREGAASSGETGDRGSAEAS